jgi:guanylate kinase
VLEECKKNSIAKRRAAGIDELDPVESNIDTVKSNIDGYLSVGVDGFVNFEHIIDFVYDFFLNTAPKKLYIISAPSGYGKSTLVDRLRYLGVRQLPKITTRKPRPGEGLDKSMEFVSAREYYDLLKKVEVIGHAEANKGAYGIRRDLLENISGEHCNYAIDRDFEAACKIKAEYPDKVKLVALFPSLSFAGFGLEDRINKLKMPIEGFGSFIEELEFLKRSRYTFQDTKDRLKRIVRQAKEFQEKLPDFDIVLDKYDMKKNEALLLEKMAKW